MKSYKLTYKRFGQYAILIEWPNEISEDVNRDILSYSKVLKSCLDLKDVIIAYNSLTLLFFEKVPRVATEKIKKLYRERGVVRLQSVLWEIPVCYDLEFGLDLEEMSTTKKISVDEIVKMHTNEKYYVYFVGFQPGFLYLGGLNENLFMSRKKSPRIRVPKGSVAIGGNQTGIYPQESSGGWNIIGQTPISLFDSSKNPPVSIKAGDYVKFMSISNTEFDKIENEVVLGEFNYNKLVNDKSS